MPPTLTRASSGYGRALRAAAVWAVATLLMTLALAGPPPSAGPLIRAVCALVVSMLVAALLVWPLTRTHRPFWLLLLMALPAFLAVRLVLAVATG